MPTLPESHTKRSVDVVFVHQVLANQIRPATLVRLVAQDRQVDGVAQDMEIPDGVLAELHKEHRIVIVIFCDFRTSHAAMQHQRFLPVFL